MNVSDLMKKEFSYLQTEETLASAARKMAQDGISEVPVMQGWKYAGIIRLADISGAAVKGGMFQKPSLDDPKKVQGQKIMKYVRNRGAWLKPGFDLASVLLYIRRNNAEVVPIVDSQTRLVGVIYASEICREISKMLMDAARGTKDMPSVQQGPERKGSQTPIDQLVRLVEKKGSVKVSEAAKVCGLSNSEIQDYAKSLEKSNLIRIEYGIIGTRLVMPKTPKQGI